VRGRAFSLALALVSALGTAACNLDVGSDGAWVPADLVAAPRTLRSGTTATVYPPPPRPGPLRVVSYNVHLGDDPAGLAAAILADPAVAVGDVFLIQEEEDHFAEERNRTAQLAEQLDLHWIYVPARVRVEATHGLSILSRFPIETPQVMDLPPTEGFDTRIAIRADIAIGEARVPVVDVHLDVRLNITDRILQLRPAVIDLPEAVIVAGDYNTNPYLWQDGKIPLFPTAQIVDTDQAPILDDYMAGLGFATPGADAGPTHSVLNLESRLDAIYVRGFATTPATVERDVLASDHWPVWVDITLR
jgi:endonuclease/exonuclease/phosphatase family metal-dependent hydrolase